MKKVLLSLFLFILVIHNGFSQLADKEWWIEKKIDTSWYNSSQTTFTLRTAEQLAGFMKLSSNNNFAGKTIKLGNNIDLNPGVVFSKNWDPKTNDAIVWAGATDNDFAGIFDGCGYTVKGIYEGPLLGDVKNGTVRNLNIENSFSASIIDEAYSATIENCTVETFNKTIVSGTFYTPSGAVVNYAESSTITNCTFTGYSETGAGILGNSKNTDIADCKNTGEPHIAGIAYIANNISNCRNEGAPTFYGIAREANTISECVNMSQVYIAGIAEKANTIQRCENRGTVSSIENNINSTNDLAGIACEATNVIECNNYADIENNLSSGSASGIVDNGGTISKCNNYGTVTSNNYANGIAYDAENISECNNTKAITGQSEAFGIANEANQISLCNNSATITGNDAAGIADFAKQISQCVNTGDIKGSDSGAGIASVIESGINRCHNTGTVYGESAVGLVITTSSTAEAYSCYNTGNIEGQTGTTTGLFGGFEGKIYGCYNTGDISGQGTFNAGIIVNAENCTVQGCYNTGNISGQEYSAGIVAYAKSYCTVQGCYNTGKIKALTYSGGIVALATNSCTIQGCYNLGKVENAEYYTGNIVGCGQGNISDCGYLFNKEIPGNGQDKKDNGAKYMSENEIVSGLNKMNSVIGSNIWKTNASYNSGSGIITLPTLDGETAPTVSGESSSGTETPTTGIYLDYNSLTMTVGETSTLKATVTPNDATDKTVTWKTSNPNIATVRYGVVTAISAGSATITATASGGQKATCTVFVEEEEIVSGEIEIASGGLESLNVERGSNFTFNSKISFNGTGTFKGYIIALVYDADVTEELKSSQPQKIEIRKGDLKNIKIELNSSELETGNYSYFVATTDLNFENLNIIYSQNMTITQGEPLQLKIENEKLSATNVPTNGKSVFTALLKNTGTTALNGYYTGAFIEGEYVVYNFAASELNLNGNSSKEIKIDLPVNQMGIGTYSFAFLVAFAADDLLNLFYTCDINITEAGTSIENIEEAESPMAFFNETGSEIRIMSNRPLNRVMIYNTSGEMIKSANPSNRNGISVVSAENFSSGIYILDITDVEGKNYKIKALKK